MSELFPPYEGIVDAYPSNKTLRDEFEVTVRPLGRHDSDCFFEFFKAVPENERLFIKHKVHERSVINHWCEAIDLEKNFPLLAFNSDGLVVAAATLHQAGYGWKRHIGRVSVFVHPDFRKRGLAMCLVKHILKISRTLGLEKLEAEFVAEQERAINVFAHLGFSEIVRIRKYVMDMQGAHHDWILMGIHLPTDIEYAGVGG